MINIQSALSVFRKKKDIIYKYLASEVIPSKLILRSKLAILPRYDLAEIIFRYKKIIKTLHIRIKILRENNNDNI